MNLKELIRSIPDFPEKGIIFRDITPLIHDKDALKFSVLELEKLARKWDFDYVCGPEARGFIFGVPLAVQMNKGFIPVRKEGKLPYEKISQSYQLEYGKTTVEMHKDAIKPGDRVLLIDDLLATGGTSRAIADMVESLGGEVVGCLFLIELDDLNGREKLHDFETQTLIHF